jgi:hypothetical protein
MSVGHSQFSEAVGFAVRLVCSLEDDLQDKQRSQSINSLRLHELNRS